MLKLHNRVVIHLRRSFQIFTAILASHDSHFFRKFSKLNFGANFKLFLADHLAGSCVSKTLVSCDERVILVVCSIINLISEFDTLLLIEFGSIHVLNRSYVLKRSSTILKVGHMIDFCLHCIFFFLGHTGFICILRFQSRLGLLLSSSIISFFSLVQVSAGLNKVLR